MANYAVVNHALYGQKSWRGPSDYSFAQGTAMVPVAAQELPRAAMAFPLAFVADGADFVLVALTALLPNNNYFVGPAGQWLGDYVPADLRCYPFRMVAGEGNDLSLTVDEESGLVEEGQGTDGSTLFFEGGSNQPHPKTLELMQFLANTHNGMAAMRRVTASLHNAGLLEPWPLQIANGDQRTPVGGLSKVSEAKLADIPVDVLDSLRNSGGLPVIYAQLLSMQNIRKLQILAEIKAAEPANKPVAPLDLASLDDDKFDWSTILGK